MTVKIRPNCFEDSVAILALYRPGPLDSGMAEEYIKRKHGKEKIKYLHPLLDTILKDTYGVIVYQEQVMQIAQVLAAIPWATPISCGGPWVKKIPKKWRPSASASSTAPAPRKSMKKEQRKFSTRWKPLRATVSINRTRRRTRWFYQTAYLKTHYPVEFMAALMTSEMGDTDKIIKNLSECRAKDIEVLAPDVDESRSDFTPIGDKIRFGLAAVKNVGEKAVEVILESRSRTAPSNRSLTSVGASI